MGVASRDLIAPELCKANGDARWSVHGSRRSATSYATAIASRRDDMQFGGKCGHFIETREEANETETCE